MSIKNYGLITDIQELRVLVEKLHRADVIAIDIETGFLGPDREKGSVHPETAILVGISFTDSTDWARYVPLGHDNNENLDNRAVAELFWPLLSRGTAVAHNAGFELRHLSKWFRQQLSDHVEYGEQVRERNGYFPIRSDTLVEAYLVAEYKSFGLKSLTKAMFDHTMTELPDLFENLPKNRHKFLRFNILDCTDPRVVEYACEDSVWCLAIHEAYYPQVKDRLLFRVDKAIVQDVVPEMEDEGICYDWAFLRQAADSLRAFRDRYNAEIMDELSARTGETVAINLASAPQLSTMLFEKLGLRTSVYTASTRNLPHNQRKMSSGKVALAALAKTDPTVKKILQWKQISKLLGSYLDKYEKAYNYADDGRAHPNHLTAFVITGRFAVSDPNYTQSPKRYHYDLESAKKVHQEHEDAHGKDCTCDEFPTPPGSCWQFNFRDAIVAPKDHYILGFDLSQAELRAIAGEAQEKALLEAFDNDRDVHKLTASLMLGVPLEEVTKSQRDVGKTLAFALGYGMLAKGLADRLGVSIEEAQELFDKYFAAYPAIPRWSARQVEIGRRQGYVTSKFGRKLPIWEYQSDKIYMHQKGDRACVNYKIQGAATGDLVRIMMVRTRAALREAGLHTKVRLVMNIHDALEWYVHKSVLPQTVIKVLQSAITFPIPGWPKMKADWHLAKKWGSQMEVDVKDDGSLIVKGEKVWELAPELDDDESEDEPEQEMVEILTEPEPGRHVLVHLPDMPTQDGWSRFVQLVKDTLGDNTLSVLTPEGEISFPTPTGLSHRDLAIISALLGPAKINYDEADVEPADIVSGLTL